MARRIGPWFAASLLSLLCACETTLRSGPRSIDAARAEAQAVQLVNDARTAAGLPALAVDPRLSRAARSQSETMRAKGSLSPDATSSVRHWGELRSRVEQAGYRPRVVRENVAGGEGLGLTELHTMLMESPKHKANILASDCRDMGAGVVFSNGRLYLTHVFAMPRE